MSASDPAAPDSSLNVRYTREVQGNRGAGELDQVEILEDEEHHADLRTQQANISVTLEKDQLQTRYDELSNSYSQLQEEITDKKGKRCPEGWQRFGCSCYFKSNGNKTWAESRSDCQNKGAHLVTISSREEQNFVIGLKKNGESWIGLTEIWKQTGWEWEWVDGSPLTLNFWATGSPDQNGNQYAAACCDRQGRWTQSKFYGDSKIWICEKQISCIL